MKVVILAGGLGSRLSEETDLKPKPMVEIGGFPILVHIMKIYSFFGLSDFIICCGYKANYIKEYFQNFYLYNSDVTFDLSNNQMIVHEERSEPWKVTLVDTGNNSMTGGRLKRIKPYIDPEDDFFCMTYGDGLADINIKNLIEFHKKHNKLATITSTTPPGRFGILDIDSNNQVISIKEKTQEEQPRINGGYFVLSPKIFDYIEGDDTVWELEPLQKLSQNSNLMAFHHDGFWQPMDTLREKNLLEKMWHSNNAPWKVWND